MTANRIHVAPSEAILEELKVRYSHEQITALRLEWLAHIIVHLEKATAK